MGRHRPSIILNHKVEASLDNKKCFLACAHFVHKWTIKICRNANLVSKFYLMANSKKTTSAKAAKAASKVLRDGRTSKASKTAAGSALSQKVGRKKSG